MAGWQKGESGNPFGRIPKVNAFRMICQEYAPQAFEQLRELVENKGTHEAVRFQGLKFILEHAWGKAPQSIEIKVQDSIAPNMMTSKQLELAAANKTKELVFSLIESGKIAEYERAYKEGSLINDKEVVDSSVKLIEQS